MNFRKGKPETAHTMHQRAVQRMNNFRWRSRIYRASLWYSLHVHPMPAACWTPTERVLLFSFNSLGRLMRSHYRRTDELALVHQQRLLPVVNAAFRLPSLSPGLSTNNDGDTRYSVAGQRFDTRTQVHEMRVANSIGVAEYFRNRSENGNCLFYFLCTVAFIRLKYNQSRADIV